MKFRPGQGYPAPHTTDEALRAIKVPSGPAPGATARPPAHRGAAVTGKFRKKPVEIQAIQWTGSNTAEVIAFAGVGTRDVSLLTEPPALAIRTLEGVMRADVGDWIIRGVQGEFYPIKDAIFRETYEAVE